MTKNDLTSSGGSRSAWPSTVAVIGAAGLIGSGVVERLAVEGLADTVYLTDLRDNILQAHAIDIAEAQILAGSTHTQLVVGPPPPGLPVDLVIVAASAPETPDGDRRDFLLANLRLLRILLPDIERLAGDHGVVMLLSNPVDVLSDALHRMSCIAPDRIVGYSLNDSIRFRAAVGREIGARPEHVSGLVLGEHGDGQVPLYSTLAVNSVPLVLSSDQRDRITADITGWFSRWSALKPGRSSGWTTPLGVAQIIKSMASGGVHPATIWTGALPELPDTFVSVPTVFRDGRLVPVLPTLSEQEITGLAQAARSVGTAAAEAVEALQATPK
ncbi:lactate/malate family dehydrogenase [Arthrobacter mangrovi]|uniref:L-lactate dehydrogenase n=1 Tax=Arthrobacter mangrovi TaxID=2966350 RepID=A0ABQ5MSD3_9MICC|nr:hypothetical protein [Arthrobacter mangrovi]GLB66572.1 L-lactate dehydrogenase [Arthrobacter mangrovi]